MPIKLPFPEGTIEAAADEVVSHAAYERVFGWEASEYKNLGEQAEEYKRIRRDNVPRVVEYVKKLVDG